MRWSRTVSAILRGRWLIDKHWAESQLPLVLSLLKGETAAVERSGSQFYEMPFAVDPKTMQRHNMFVYIECVGYKPNPNIPEGSVAVIPVSGPILKYNGECGEPGSLQRIGWLMDAERRTNISSAVMMIDSPGGQVDGTQSFANALKNFSKPTIGFVDDGIAASAAMWVLSAADESYTSLESDQVGSVGVYTSLLDFRGWLEKEGLKLHEIYAPQSTDKNLDYREALKGNYDLVLEDLKVTAETFIRSVRTNRGDKAAANQKMWDSGKMFYAKDAMNVGLIDGVKSFEHVVSKAAWLGKRKKY
jgi:protease-4